VGICVVKLLGKNVLSDNSDRHTEKTWKLLCEGMMPELGSNLATMRQKPRKLKPIYCGDWSQKMESTGKLNCSVELLNSSCYHTYPLCGHGKPAVHELVA
jgi:hypothetical protein